MKGSPEAGKVDAIYKLREAAEMKARIEVAVDVNPSPRAVNALLDAKLTLEERTQDAIEVCHECEHDHPGGEEPESRERITERRDNVVDVDFRPGTEREKS